MDRGKGPVEVVYWRKSWQERAIFRTPDSSRLCA